MRRPKYHPLNLSEAERLEQIVDRSNNELEQVARAVDGFNRALWMTLEEINLHEADENAIFQLTNAIDDKIKIVRRLIGEVNDLARGYRVEMVDEEAAQPSP